MNFNNSWSTPIDKLMIWRTDSWNKFETKVKLIMKIHYDQLLIIANTKIIESLNMHTKIKGIYKDDIMILIFNAVGYPEVRKIKFQIKSNVLNCIQKLAEHFPVINHKQHSIPINIMAPKYRRIEEVFKTALDSKENATSVALPANFSKFVKLCLLDPMFPQVVLETEKILSSELMKNKLYTNKNETIK